MNLYVSNFSCVWKNRMIHKSIVFEKQLDYKYIKGTFVIFIIKNDHAIKYLSYSLKKFGIFYILKSFKFAWTYLFGSIFRSHFVRNALNFGKTQSIFLNLICFGNKFDCSYNFLSSIQLYIIRRYVKTLNSFF